MVTKNDLRLNHIAALDGVPIWTQYLSKQKGIGRAMAGVIISELDPAKAERPSDFWAYAGLDVAPDGRGRSKRKEHLIERTYRDAKGKEQTRLSVTYNPFLKTKLIGVLGPSFLRSRSPWREVYDGYKHRLEHRPDTAEWTPGHRHAAAIRYMVKMFLLNLHLRWRELEGLPVSNSYAEARLGIVHGRAASP
jgi:hypothetical protein